MSIIVLVLSLLCACQTSPRSGLDFNDDWPERLSDWQLFERRSERLTLNNGVMPYDLNSALFTDYAHKFRTISVPLGTEIQYAENAFRFPIGTVISKTFYYPRSKVALHKGRQAVLKTLDSAQGESLDLTENVLLETRLLVNTSSGWIALPYVWDAEQTDATLELAGETFSLALVNDNATEPFEYLVPDANQCANCHAVIHRDQRLEPIGVKARHLNKQYEYARTTANQLEHWQSRGLLAAAEVDLRRAPRNAQWDQATTDVNARARAYLDVNCSHCHSATAAANTSGLFLEAAEIDLTHIGICKIPGASGRGSASAEFDIVPGAPNESILLKRMQSTEPDIAMPELGRTLVHQEGVALIRQWIASLPGDCAAVDH